ncbi:von Willebrand factor A domain-containing protein 7-like [Engraulis encrasicolus]|uniref:von Willebrand factor A domain-containing protein 7-like n=1 Tax=Engraulis encrasicolus TaxID=184585 RepID=UPI002FD0504C
MTDFSRKLSGGLLIFMLLQTQTFCFKVLLFSKKPHTTTHQQMTETAILQTTAEACRTLAQAEGTDFVLPKPLTAESLAKACVASDSAKHFRSSINRIRLFNGLTDLYVFSEERHFDNEKILGGRQRIKLGLDAVKANIKQDNFDAARRSLGQTLHTLQDFYSHSNWIELGRRVPFSALIKPDVEINNIAGIGTPTCGNCDGQNCNNILQSIIDGQILTTGYFGLNPFSKPPGKCSHGGFGDVTSLFHPKRGINKDDEDSIHGGLHATAAAVATNATQELLQDIRGAAGDKNFLRLMGMTVPSSVLCFVIDTTGSMSDDIAEVRRVTANIVNSRRGTLDEPPEYILVPFNDPEFGPLMRTTDADVFIAQVNALTATGGGDTPEMSLSGLQLALTGAPEESEIFLFTDAPAKDTHLRSTVLALIERTRSVVNCMLTGSLGSRRRRADDDSGQSQGLRLSSRTSTQLYDDLAQASGGQAIKVTKANLPQATSIIADSSGEALVTIFQAVRNPGKADNFSFTVDNSLRNLTMYITGTSPTFTITSPAGMTQSNTASTGAVGTIQSVGNFWTVRLNSTGQGGLWGISMASTQPYSIKVTGQSGIDFLFDFVEIFSGAHPTFDVLPGRPSANENATLLLTVTGGDSVSVSEVLLVPTSGAEAVDTTVEEREGGDYLVTVDRLPEGEFNIRIRGETNAASRASPDVFERQSSTQLRTSSLTVTVAALNETWEPGTSLTVPFTVSTDATGDITIRATNDRGFTSESPASLTPGTGGQAEGTVTLTAPPSTTSGTDVTLTIEAETAGATDSNYAVLRLSVVAEVTDLSAPTCDIVGVNANCSGNCSLSWELLANLTDGDGTGIERITVRQGSGSLNTRVVTGSDGVNVTLATYTASCCSEEVELVAVDAVGNVGTCFRSIAPPPTTATSPTPTTTTMQTEPVAETTWDDIDDSIFSGQSRSLDLGLPLWLSLISFWLVGPLQP